MWTERPESVGLHWVLIELASGPLLRWHFVTSPIQSQVIDFGDADVEPILRTWWQQIPQPKTSPP